MFPIGDHNPSHKPAIIAWLIIAMNIVVFLYQLASPHLETFIHTYALVPETVNFFEVNTLVPFITSMFLHGGFLHIASNMWFLWIFGDNIEAALGHIKFIIFYLLAGLGAGLLQYMINPGLAIPVLGASGAIAGVLGGYLVLYPHAKIETLVVGFGFWTRVNLPASFMLVYWFVIQLFSGVGSLAVTTGDEGGVAFFAHIGGFAVGWVLIKLFKPRLSWYRIK